MRKQGTVKFFRKDRGFGFITPKDGSKDVFVHYTDIECEDSFKTLLDGQHVEYDEVPGDRGPKAKNVKIVPME